MAFYSNKLFATRAKRVSRLLRMGVGLLLALTVTTWGRGSLADPAAPATGEGRVVEEVVAIIRSPSVGQTRIITLSRLEEETRVALVWRGGVSAAFRPLDAAALQAGLEWLIDQTVLFDEVTRLQVFDVERSEVLAERNRFKGRFQRPEDYQAFLDRLEMSEEELDVLLRRMLRVQRYLGSRVRAGRVRDAEVESYFHQHPSEFEGRELSAVREAIRAQLAAERVNAEVKSFLADLRGRSEIRILSKPRGER